MPASDCERVDVLQLEKAPEIVVGGVNRVTLLKRQGGNMGRTKKMGRNEEITGRCSVSAQCCQNLLHQIGVLG